MKRLLIIALLFAATNAVADTNVSAPYNAAATIYFELRDAEGSTPGLDLEASAVCATGDATISKDGGAFVNAGSCFTDETGGLYSLALTATELQAKVISVKIVDQTGTKVWVDKISHVYTHGDASSFQGTSDVNVASIDSGAVTAAAIATDAIGASELAADAIGASEIASGAIVKGTELTGLNDLSAAQVNTEVDTGLSDYDAPTKAELDSGFSGQNDVSAADVNAQCDTALSDYDGPTKAELDTAQANVTVVAASAAAINDFFSVDSGTTSASAVAGSVVKEIVDNAGGGSCPTAADNADAIWDESRAGHTSAGTFGLYLDDQITDVSGGGGGGCTGIVEGGS